MRIGVVLGLPGEAASELAGQLACGSPDDTVAAVQLSVPGVALALRSTDIGTVRTGPGHITAHDGGVTGEPSPAVGTIPGCGVVVHVSSGQVTVARDAVGVRPFHVARAGTGAVLGASQLAGLAAHPSVTRIDTVPPGHTAILSPDSVSIRPGLSLESLAGPQATAAPAEAWLAEAIADLRRSLAAAVARRVPPGDYHVLLSGGVDSSAVLALAHRVNSRVQAVTVAADGSPDLSYASRLTADLSVPLEVVQAPDEGQLLAELDDMVARVETWESQVLTHAFPTWAALSALRGRGSVVLTGEGSDELLGGYRTGVEPADEVLIRRLRELGNLHRTSCQRLDRLGAAAGIDVRLPFLDPDVLRSALRLPATALVRQGLSKVALRAAMRDILPGYILERPKMTFARGVGYRYGSQAEGRGLLAAGFPRQIPVPADRQADVDRLSSGMLERYTLGQFFQHGYNRAAYLLSRTL